MRFEFLVDAEARRAVGYLAEEGGGETVVETERARGAEDVGECSEHGFGRIAAAGLESHFYCWIVRIELSAEGREVGYLDRGDELHMLQSRMRFHRTRRGISWGGEMPSSPFRSFSRTT